MQGEGLSRSCCEQVQKHAEKMQRAKEEAALGKLRAQWPELSEAVLVLALEEVSWEMDHATLLLHKFQSALGPKLDALAQARRQCRVHPALPRVQARLWTRKVLACRHSTASKTSGAAQSSGCGAAAEALTGHGVGALNFLIPCFECTRRARRS